jgi:hypothetical protein
MRYMNERKGNDGSRALPGSALMFFMFLLSN